MSAYATHPAQLQALATDPVHVSAILDTFINQLADKVAARLANEARSSSTTDDWLDSRHAAEYLGVHRDTLRKLAAERAIPSEQDGPGCKLYFRRADLDAWRQSGGRPRHLALAA